MVLLHGDLTEMPELHLRALPWGHPRRVDVAFLFSEVTECCCTCFLFIICDMASLFLNITVSGIGKAVCDFLLAYTYMPEQGCHLLID